MKKLYSFVYAPTLSEENLIAALDALAQRLGLSKNVCQDSAGGWNFPNIEEEMLRHIFSPNKIAELRDKGYVPVEAHRLKMFTKVTPIRIYKFDSLDGKIAITARCADDNTYPMLSMAIWSEENLMLPGGILEINVEDNREGMLIDDEIQRITDQTPDSDSCRIAHWRTPPGKIGAEQGKS